MPTADAITRMLGTTANELAWLAIAWHVAVVGALLALLLGWRPSKRVACILLTAPIVSVAAASFSYGNLFNAISFGVLALMMAVIGEALPHTGVERAPAWRVVVGGSLMVFGAIYPHFVEGSWFHVLIAAPIGVVPCPTLAFVAGVAIIAGGFGSRAIPLLLLVWVGFYAWFGVLHLGVTLDLGLGVALLALAVTARSAA